MIEKIIALLLPGLIPKKAPYCLWVLEVIASSPGAVIKPFWSNRNPSGSSARRCGKAAKQYVDKGVPLGSIMILPKGILPPTVGG
jgi:hypothetical protein